MYKYTLDNKPLFKKDNGDEIRDLTSKIFDVNSKKVNNYKLYKVSKDMVMRPDLMSSTCYGTSEYADIIMKYSNISNPFSIDVGDIVIIPNRTNILDNVLTNAKDFDGSLANRSYKYIDPTKFPNTDNNSSGKPNISDFNNRLDKILPPNITGEIEEQITHRNGRVYFGENIGKSCLYDGMSSGEYLQTIVKKNKL